MSELTREQWLERWPNHCKSCEANTDCAYYVLMTTDSATPLAVYLTKDAAEQAKINVRNNAIKNFDGKIIPTAFIER